MRLLLILSVALLVGCAQPAGDAPARGRTLLIGAIVPPGERGQPFREGAELGGAEAQRVAELIGVSFDLRIMEAAGPAEAAAGAAELHRAGAYGVIGGWETEVCASLAEAAEELGLLLLNVGCRHEQLRTPPAATTFHVEASESMYRAAADEEAIGGEPVLWHPSLFRFGAEQLNDRYVARFGTSPSGAAWAAWFGVKVLWESAVRNGTTDLERLVTFLSDDATSFDGHKGQSLAFDPETRQLRQPLYRSTAGGAVEVDPLSGGSAGLDLEAWRALEGRPVPEGQYAIVTNEGSSDVVVIDVATGQLVSRIRVDARPRGLRVAPDGRFVYIALSDDAPTTESDRDGIALIDLRAGRVLETFPAGSDPEQFALSPEGSLLFAANEDAGTATVTDLRRKTALATMTVGIEPEGVAASDDGRWVYVTAETSNTVSVIDVARLEVVASFLVDVRPRAAAFAPGSPRAYVTNEISRTVSVVDTESHTVVAAVEIPDPAATPVGVVVSPDARRVYVANGHANSVSVIDAGTLVVIADIPVGRRPWGIAITPDGRQVYTANGLSNDVSIIDTQSLSVVRTVGVAQRPWGVALTP